MCPVAAGPVAAAQVACTPSSTAPVRCCKTNAAYAHGWAALPCFPHASRFFPDSVSRAIPDSYLHSIYAASFKRTNTYFVLAWNEEYDGVPAYDVTKYYLAAARAAAGGSAPPPPVRDAKEMGAVEGVDEEARAGGVWQRDAHAWVHTA